MGHNNLAVTAAPGQYSYYSPTMGVCSSSRAAAGFEPDSLQQQQRVAGKCTCEVANLGQKGSFRRSNNHPSYTHETPRGDTPHLVFANDSIYTVSYSVIQENKMRTTEHTERTASRTNLRLLLGHAGAGIQAGAGHDMEEMTKWEGVGLFRMKDFRMAPGGKTPPTEVPFPADCEELRVLAYFRNGRGAWQLYKNKVYSTGSSRSKKSFILTAMDNNIAPYSTDNVGGATTPGG